MSMFAHRPFRPQRPGAGYCGARKRAAVAAALAAAPGFVFAAGAADVIGGALKLPLMLALAVGVHVALGRAAKWLAGAISPLASGEEEAVRYQRDVYGTPERDVLEVVGLVLGAGVLLWAGTTVAPGWLTTFGVVLLLAAVGLDLQRWERATASANFVWFQRGLGRKVQQIAIENIADVAVQEEEVGGFTLRHGKRNRICRVHLRMNDKRVVSLPRTDAHRGLDDVETLANHVRARQQIMDEQENLSRAGRDSRGATVPPPARELSAEEREMRRELKRLRSQALAPDVPPAVRMPPASEPEREK
jgi:hypothetical protein